MLKSAGIILIHISDYKILLVRHKTGHWGFPKGNIEKSENLKETAIRELKEETNAEPNIIFEKPTFEERYPIIINNRKKIKSVTYFIGFTCDTYIQVNTKELSDAQWFTLKETKQLKFFPSRKLITEIETLLNANGPAITITPPKNCKNSYKHQRIQGSKHLYSRIAPLAILNPNIVFRGAPKTIDTAIINKVIRLANQANDYLFIPKNLCELSRSIIAIIPAALYKHKKVIFYYPKGCNIGMRKIDIYLQIMEQFGVRVSRQNDIITISKKNSLKGIKLKLPFPSFTGTSTALLMASIAKQKTVLENISTEPEILEMIHYLQVIGIDIRFISERSVTVNGGKISNKKNIISVSVDRNAIVTKIMAALIQEQTFLYSSKIPLCLSPLIEVFERMGVNFSYSRYSFILKKTI